MHCPGSEVIGASTCDSARPCAEGGDGCDFIDMQEFYEAPSATGSNPGATGEAGSNPAETTAPSATSEAGSAGEPSGNPAKTIVASGSTVAE